MRLTRQAVLAGLASLAVAGAAMAAEAPRFHTMNLHLADGAVVQVRYSGTVAPTVTVAREPAQSALDPAGFLAGLDTAPFAALDRVAAEMDREADAMLRQARLGAPGNAQGASWPGLDLVAGGGFPVGAAGYSFVSETTSDGGCTRSVEVTRAAPTAKPNVVTHQSGDCAAAGAPAAPRSGASAAVKPAKPAAGTAASRTI